MKTKRSFSVLLALVLGAVLPAMAQNRVATTAAPFLTIGTGARGTSLGDATTAFVTGPDALFWNPGGAAIPTEGAGLGGVFFTQTEWLADTEYNAFALTIPVLQRGVLGASIGMLDYGRMEVRTVDRPEGVGQSFGASDLVVGLTYAQPLTDSFYLGVTAKGVRQAIWDMTAQTFAVDVGFTLQTNYLNGMRLAASIMNFGGKMRMAGINNRIFVDFDETSSGSNDAIPARLELAAWDLPISFRFGVLVPVFTSNNARLDVFTDAQQTNDNNLNADAGAQLRFMIRKVTLDLRSGYRDIGLPDNTSHLTFGGGLGLQLGGNRLAFDFAYVPYEFFGHTQTFDLRFLF